MTQTKGYRMKLSTYRRFRKEFKKQTKDESIASYFERLSKHLEGVKK